MDDKSVDYKDCKTCYHSFRSGNAEPCRSCDQAGSNWEDTYSILKQEVVDAQRIYSGKTSDKQDAESLVNAHWEYMEQSYRLAMPWDSIEWGVDELLDLVEHTYKSAFHHGIKHAKEGDV